MAKADPRKSEIVLYQTEDGRTRLEVKLENETVWLTQGQMAELFQTTQQNISLHLQNLYEEGELTAEATHKEFLSVRREGSRNVQRRLDCYNLDVIISVGYRVKSLRGTQFRIWATQRLREFIVKGFTLDDERLKEGGGAYFDELLARIREIRAAERNFYQKIKDIYATSVDYDEAAEITQDFFAMAQNKLHWASRRTQFPALQPTFVRLVFAASVNCHEQTQEIHHRSPRHGHHRHRAGTRRLYLTHRHGAKFRGRGSAHRAMAEKQGHGAFPWRVGADQQSGF
jgi:hypothetical protein